MKLVAAAAVSTTLVVVLGFIMVFPIFFGPAQVETKQRIMLSFSVSESNDVVNWCKNLSSILDKYDLSAAVFIVGKVAEQNPECVRCFSDKVDVGSQTYSNSNLTSIPDYAVQLEEVRKGKLAVETAGNLISKVFMAPNKATDQNIYSLLSQNGILADFSYDGQYNVYSNTQFIKFDASVFDGASCSADFLLERDVTSKLIILHFDSGYPTKLIEDFITALLTGQFDLVSASEVTELELTVRGA